MWKWIVACIGCIFLLQGCVAKESGEIKKQVKENTAIKESVNEQLLQAAERGETDTIKNLLKKEVNINVQDSKGKTPVMLATYNNDVMTVKVLIDAGADINIADREGITLLQHAEEKGYKEIVKILRKEKFDALSESSRNQIKEQFFQAANQGNTSMITQLLNKGIDINVQDKQGRTAAMIATYGNHPKAVKALIDRSADINIRDNMKNNPFLYAGAEGYLEILKLTIKAGADPKLLNRYGGTALIPAGEHGHIENIRELLEHTDVDVNHINHSGWTALLEAIVYGDGGKKYQESIKLLIKYGADVNLADTRQGLTPLQHAKQRGFTEISKILIHAGAK